MQTTSERFQSRTAVVVLRAMTAGISFLLASCAIAPPAEITFGIDVDRLH